MRKDAGKLVFQCQLATGSPTGLISNFKSATDLYAKIAEAYDIDPSDILYCTLNTHKVQMDKILASQIGLNDFIFAHLKGTKKEVEVEKTSNMLGVTISDNGKDKCFIKRLKAGSTIAGCEPAVQVGDHIEKIDGELMVGKRHFEVARKLKSIPVGTKFALRLIEPQRCGLVGIGPRTGRGTLPAALGAMAVGDPAMGHKTLRFKGGKAVVEDVATSDESAMVGKVGEALENYLGVSDPELARAVWEAALECADPTSLAARMEGGELAELGIPRDLVFDLWGLVGDAKRPSKSSTTPALSLPPNNSSSLHHL